MQDKNIGRSNNKKGNDFEDEVVALIQSLGQSATPRVLLPKELGVAPFGTQTRLSVLISKSRLFPKGLGIDASRYTTAGSAVQKIPYKILNASNWKIPGAVILDGQGRGITAAREWAIKEHMNLPNLAFAGDFAAFQSWLEATVAAG